MIHDAQMDYYGTRLATCSSDRSVKIFDVRNSGQILIADLRGHEGPVWQVAWAHPMYGNILASCSYDRKVIIWKEENGTWEKTHEHTGHDSSVNSVCWAPHDYGLILACGSSDGAISLLTYTGEGQWEVKKINNAHTIGCNAVSWAPAVVPGSLIDQPSGQKPNYIKKFASGGCDNLIKLWKEEEDGQWKEEQKLEAHSDWVRDVAWAPSIGLPTSTIASCSQDGRVFIWTCDDASSNMWSPKLLHKFNDVVWHVSWSITANILAVSGGDNKAVCVLACRLPCGRSQSTGSGFASVMSTRARVPCPLQSQRASRMSSDKTGGAQLPICGLQDCPFLGRLTKQLVARVFNSKITFPGVVKTATRLIICLDMI
ncbi:protein SEC13 homolog isoform X3 [Pteropus vampyrus]|uniref:Protein SEC13 homolog n=1 Tax=Pteropus vampyrus TaxID=132908 RepID=A0A6P6CZ98_PTEVA|nr:protein SEC13 homolog isoform X3 [Pteropus vampyrus]